STFIKSPPEGGADVAPHAATRRAAPYARRARCTTRLAGVLISSQPICNEEQTQDRAGASIVAKTRAPPPGSGREKFRRNRNPALRAPAGRPVLRFGQLLSRIAHLDVTKARR